MPAQLRRLRRIHKRPMPRRYVERRTGDTVVVGVDEVGTAASEVAVAGDRIAKKPACSAQRVT